MHSNPAGVNLIKTASELAHFTTFPITNLHNVTRRHRCISSHYRNKTIREVVLLIETGYWEGPPQYQLQS